MNRPWWAQARQMRVQVHTENSHPLLKVHVGLLLSALELLLHRLGARHRPPIPGGLRRSRSWVGEVVEHAATTPGHLLPP